MRFSTLPACTPGLHLLRALLTPADRRPSPSLLQIFRCFGWAVTMAAVPLLHAQKIVTIAGNGTAGYVAAQEGGPATRAQLDEPYGTAVDQIGNLYIAERASHRIRRVDLLTGTITTVAGDGHGGFRAEDEGALATQAELNGPRALAVDLAGDLYVADTENHRVRRIDARTGRITTLAGTGVAGFRAQDEHRSAILAELDSPRAVAVDRFGNVYIGDYNNQRIRKVEAATGLMYTIAGTGTPGYLAAQGGGPAAEAEINDPCGIALDAAGNLYIADTGNHRVRRVEGKTGIITTVAGNGSSGYRTGDEGKLATRATLSAPSAVAVDARGDLYIADMEEHRVRRVDAATGAMTTVAGAGVPGYILVQDGEIAAGARLNKPRGLAVDARGAIYVADSANNRVRKIEPVNHGVDVAIR